MLSDATLQLLHEGIRMIGKVSACCIMHITYSFAPMRANTCIHTHAHTCTHTRTNTHTNARMHTYTHTHAIFPIISTHSFVELTRILLAIPGVQYVLSEKFCQDTVESFLASNGHKVAAVRIQMQSSSWTTQSHCMFKDQWF